jgi:hypothetical protein
VTVTEYESYHTNEAPGEPTVGALAELLPSVVVIAVSNYVFSICMPANRRAQGMVMQLSVRSVSQVKVIRSSKFGTQTNSQMLPA